MAQGSRKTAANDYVYIDLDDSPPWWAPVVGFIAVTLIVAVLVAPWTIDWTEDATAEVANSALRSTSSFCRPNTTGLPGVLYPSLASWNQFCEWFVEPGLADP